MWIKNFKCVVTTNIKDDTRKKALFLNLAGDNLVQIFDRLSSTDTLNYSNTVKLLTEHFAPCKSVLYAIFIFRKCRRRDNESLNSFYSTLRSLSVNCEFSENLDREIIVQKIIIEPTIYYYYLFKF